MIDAITITYLLGAAGLLVGVGIWALLINDPAVDAEKGKFGYLVIIPGFAAVAYLVMASGVTTITIESDTIFPARYIDWLVTTPILVGYLAYIASAPRKWIVGVAGVDALMILVGMAAVAAATVSMQLMLGLFLLSSLCHIFLLYTIYGVLPRFVSEVGERRHLFKILQNHIGLLWLAYPFVWLASPDGLGYMSVLGTALIITYLDVIAKTPYIYFVWKERDIFATEASQDRTEPAPAGQRG